MKSYYWSWADLILGVYSMHIGLLLDLRDCWIGAYWTTHMVGQHTISYLYLCLVPCLPIRITWLRLPALVAAKQQKGRKR